MRSTLSPITAASVCFIPLTSGRPACKQNGGQRREGSERSISRSPKDTMSWDRVCDREILLCFSDNVSSCFQRRLAISYCQPVTTQWVTCKENAFIPHSLEAARSKVKRPRSWGPCCWWSPRVALDVTWHGRESLLAWNLSSSTSESSTAVTVSALRSSSIHLHKVSSAPLANTIDMTSRMVPIWGLPASNSYALAFTCNALSCHQGKSKGMVGWWPVF